MCPFDFSLNRTDYGNTGHWLGVISNGKISIPPSDSVRVTVQQLADFFVYLFEIKQLVPSTIKGNRSVIGRTISLLGGPDFWQNEYISLLVRSFSLERPKQNKLVHQWNLGLVLDSLSSPLLNQQRK